MSEVKTAEAPKTKKTRATPQPRPVFIVFQVLDAEGNVDMSFDKSRVRLITATRNAAEALEILDNGDHPGATYKSCMVKGR